MTLTPSRKEELLQRARSKIGSVRSEIRDGGVELRRLLALQETLDRLNAEVSASTMRLEPLNTTSNAPLLALAEKAVRTTPQSVDHLKQQLNSLKASAAELRRHRQSTEDELRIKSATWAELQIDHFGHMERIRVADELGSEEAELQHLERRLEEANLGCRGKLEAAEQKLAAAETARKAVQTQLAEVAEERKRFGSTTAEMVQSLRLRRPEVERMAQIAQTAFLDLVTKLVATSGQRDPINRLKLQLTRLHMELASTTADIQAAESKVSQQTTARAQRRDEEQLELDLLLGSKIWKEMEAAATELDQTPTREALEQQKSQMARQAETLTQCLADANEELFLLQENQLVSRCQETESLLQIHHSVTIPSLREQLQDLKEQRHEHKVATRLWEEEKERHISLLKRMDQEEALLDKSLKLLESQKSDLQQQLGLLEQESKHWDSEEQEWDLELRRAEELLADLHQHGKASSHDDSGFAPEVNEEVIVGSVGGRTLRRKTIAVKAPRHVVALPILRAADVRFRDIASQIFKGFVYLIAPKRAQKRQQHTLTL
jgi:chromosome segregation ATPase